MAALLLQGEMRKASREPPALAAARERGNGTSRRSFARA